MTIIEAYTILGLKFTSDLEELRKNYSYLRTDKELKNDLEAMTELETAERIVRNCIIYKQQNKFNVASKSEKEYEFYEHMYDMPKATIPFEQLLKEEIKLNVAKEKIRKYLLSLVNNLDYIYDLDKLRQFVEESGLKTILEQAENNNKKHK